jgi:hypothetical protein
MNQPVRKMGCFFFSAGGLSFIIEEGYVSNKGDKDRDWKKNLALHNGRDSGLQGRGLDKQARSSRL